RRPAVAGVGDRGGEVRDELGALASPGSPKPGQPVVDQGAEWPGEDALDCLGVDRVARAADLEREQPAAPMTLSRFLDRNPYAVVGGGHALRRVAEGEVADD